MKEIKHELLDLGVSQRRLIAEIKMRYRESLYDSEFSDILNGGKRGDGKKPLRIIQEAKEILADWKKNGVKN